MTTNEIREKFLKFFESKEHSIIDSDSVVPKDDPTVLFTTAGMQQFKRQFLGHITDFTKAATSQKCLRTDDLDEVGVTNFHHTFFEMLGNFSFGDYFKNEAIRWAWEFLTKELGMPQDKLWVSVYKDDEEAYQIWKNDIKINPKKIVRLGDKSNFWPSNAKENGPNGPCGPCSEIFFDFGVNQNCANKNCDPDCSCGRFSEVWNLVFTQFERKEGGILEPLPNKNIDTGMGLERLSAVIQGKTNNFEIDIFAPILKSIEDNIEGQSIQLSLKNKRIMADHIRAIVIAINDGVIPSNEGRGYVIKKLIVDITDIALQSGQKDACIFKLVGSVISTMSEGYPELKGKEKETSEIIKNIEQSYIKVRQLRMPEFKKAIEDLIKKGDHLARNIGEQLFIFRDTYGLTVDSMFKILNSFEPLLKDNKETLEKEILGAFKSYMKKQQELSRASSKMTGDVFTNMGLDLNIQKTEFIGYDNANATSKILRLFVGDKEVKLVNQGDCVKIILDRTPFYAESGGQIGDAGIIQSSLGAIDVEDTQKINDIYIHNGTVKSGTVKVDEKVDAQIDSERRLSIMRNHTATHLLQAALRQVCGPTVKQQGSLVAKERLRFDFTYHKALTQDEIIKIEKLVNNWVLECVQVEKVNLPIKEAKNLGALSFFAEKYGDIVRVVSIGDYSKEFCGGTHLSSTGQIGLFKITSEGAVAQGIRRLEAQTGEWALNRVYALESGFKTAYSLIKSNENDFIEKLKNQTSRLKELEKKCDQLAFETIKSSVESSIKAAEIVGGNTLYCQSYDDLDFTALRKIADFVKQKAPSSIIILGSKQKENAFILVAVTDNAVKNGIKADLIIQQIAPIFGGTGGGRAQLAQAGGKNPEKVDDALNQAIKIIKDIR